MELLVMLAESQVLEQHSPASKITILPNHGQGYVVKMEGGHPEDTMSCTGL